MSVRSFAVFQDSPSADCGVTISRTSSSASMSTLATPSNTLSGLPSPATEKENLHPVTGLSATSLRPNKKRKMSNASVLSTKSHAPSDMEEKENGSELKHRKSLSTSKAKSTSRSGKTGKEKEKRVLGSLGQRSSSRSSSSRIPLSRSNSRNMPEPIEEETEVDAAPTTKVPVNVAVQAIINSRCYDLTVSPLADLSTAYPTSSGPISVSDVGDKEKPNEQLTVQMTPFEKEIVSYFSPSSSFTSVPSSSSISASTSMSSIPEHDPGFVVFRDNTVHNGSGDTLIEKSGVSMGGSKKEEEQLAVLQLTTPERRSIYSSFTFSSPIRSPQF